MVTEEDSDFVHGMCRSAQDRYRVQEVLGAGGTGLVLAAEDKLERRRVALKTTLAAHGAHAYRLIREFRVLQSIHHCNVVKVHDLYAEEARACFSMDLVEGLSLVDALQYNRTPRRVVSLFRQVASGLHAIHSAGYLHRDLRPGNTLVTANDRVVLVDLGMTTDLCSPPWDGLAGAVAYMSPEQMNGEPATEASDWYAVGAMLYEVLCGRPPTGEGGHPELTSDSTSTLLARLARALLHPRPEERPTGARVLAALDSRPGPVSTPQPDAGAVHLLKRALRCHVRALVLVDEAPCGVAAATAEVVCQRGATLLRGQAYRGDRSPAPIADTLIDSAARCAPSSGPPATAARAGADPDGLPPLFSAAVRGPDPVPRASAPTVEDVERFGAIVAAACSPPTLIHLDATHRATELDTRLLPSLLDLPGVVVLASRPWHQEAPLHDRLMERATRAGIAVHRLEIGSWEDVTDEITLE